MSKSYKVRACVVSNIGKHRTNHEDNYLLDDGQYINVREQEELSSTKEGWKNIIQKKYPETVKSSCVFAVSDGMGGHNAGETASRIAVEQLNSMKEYIFRTSDTEGIKKRFQDYIIKANTVAVMKASQNPKLKEMGATLTGILLCEDGVMAFNLGDSRTYVLKNGRLKRITKDHTEGQRLLDYGIVKAEELHLIDGSKSITRYLGIDDKYMIPQADIGEIIEIETRTWFLICSDGLTDVLKDSELEEILKYYYEQQNIELAANVLIKKAMEDTDCRHGGIDNITVLLAEIEEHIPTILNKAINELGRLTQLFSKK